MAHYVYARPSYDHSLPLSTRRYGQPVCPTPRKVIARGISQVKALELFPRRLFAHILLANNDTGGITPNAPAEVTVSVTDKLSDVRQALYKAVFPDAKDAEYRIWELPGKLPEARHISLKDFEERQATAELENSDQIVDGSLVEDLCGFVVEVRSDGKWIVPERAEGSNSSQQTQPAEDASKPLFSKGQDFFSVLASKPATRSDVSKPTPAPPSRDPRPAPKVCNLLPGTLGLGNMYVLLLLYPSLRSTILKGKYVFHELCYPMPGAHSRTSGLLP